MALPVLDVKALRSKLGTDVTVKVLQAINISKSQQYLKDKLEQQRSQVVLDIADENEELDGTNRESGNSNSKDLYKYVVQDTLGKQAFLITKEPMPPLPIGASLKLRKGCEIWRGVFCTRTQDVQQM